jgi:hypothetical protein
MNEAGVDCDGVLWPVAPTVDVPPVEVKSSEQATVSAEPIPAATVQSVRSMKVLRSGVAVPSDLTARRGHPQDDGDLASPQLRLVQQIM